MSKRPYLLVFALLLGLGVASAAPPDRPLETKPDRHHTPSPVIFPDQQIPLRFMHDKHLALDLPCTVCHTNIEESTRASDVNIPKEEACTLCHQLEQPDGPAPARCDTCHLGYDAPVFPEGVAPSESMKVTNPPPRVVIPSPNIKFNHKVHIAREIGCLTCHEAMARLQIATRDNALPVMGKCLECHDNKAAPGTCDTCHLTGKDGTIVRTYPSGSLKPHGYYRSDDHYAGTFVKSHEAVAAADERYCESCHTKRDCEACHDGFVRPIRIHPANWALIHPTTARKNSLECSSCHREQSFCLDCHQRSRVSDRAPNDNPGVRVHPDGWVSNAAAGERPGPQHHKWQAQRNIRTCVSCHQESTCLACHSARSVPGFGATARLSGVNPHGSGFRARCKTMLRANPSVCEKCHEPSDVRLAPCR